MYKHQYLARVKRPCRAALTFGPTDTRDEAARLARTWISRVDERTAADVVGVSIERIEGDDEDEGDE